MIKKIVIKVGKKEISLTLKEAKELHESLDNFMGERTVYYPSTPAIYPYQRPYWWSNVHYGSVDCGTTGNITLSNHCLTVTGTNASDFSLSSGTVKAIENQRD